MNKTLIDLSNAFDLKANVLPIKVFRLKSLDINLIKNQLDETIKQAPKLFVGSHIVLDFACMPQGVSKDILQKIIDVILSNEMVVLGIKNITEEQQQLVRSLGVLCLSNDNQRMPVSNKQSTDKPKYKIFDGNVRSGQQIHAHDGDLIILGNVGTGAEVIALGNIHVYGALRGKAIAGAYGDKQASIFCRVLQAEILAIAGIYQISEESNWGQTDGQIQIKLANNSLKIVNL